VYGLSGEVAKAIGDRTHHRRLQKLTRDSELNHYSSLVVGESETTARSTGSSLRSSITESKFGSVSRALQQSPTSFDLLNAGSYYQGSLWLARGPLETKLGSATRQLRLPGTKRSFVELSTGNSEHQPEHGELVHSSCVSMNQCLCCSAFNAPAPPKLAHCCIGLHKDANIFFSFASQAQTSNDVHRVAYQRLIILAVNFFHEHVAPLGALISLWRLRLSWIPQTEPMVLLFVWP
jgi:hypothetical protein